MGADRQLGGLGHLAPSSVTQASLFINQVGNGREQSAKGRELGGLRGSPGSVAQALASQPSQVPSPRTTLAPVKVGLVLCCGPGLESSW